MCVVVCVRGWLKRGYWDSGRGLEGRHFDAQQAGTKVSTGQRSMEAGWVEHVTTPVTLPCWQVCSVNSVLCSLAAHLLMCLLPALALLLCDAAAATSACACWA